MGSAFQDLSKISDGVCLISAADEKQFSQEDTKWGGGHGVFTWHLLEGLKGKVDFNKDKQVNMDEFSLFFLNRSDAQQRMLKPQLFQETMTLL
jgi:uncharacterized caspase-like protein